MCKGQFPCRGRVITNTSAIMVHLCLLFPRANMDTNICFEMRVVQIEMRLQSFVETFCVAGMLSKLPTTALRTTLWWIYFLLSKNPLSPMLCSSWSHSNRNPQDCPKVNIWFVKQTYVYASSIYICPIQLYILWYCVACDNRHTMQTTFNLQCTYPL